MCCLKIVGRTIVHILLLWYYCDNVAQLGYFMSPLQQYTSKLWIYRLQANYWVHMSNELPQLKLPRTPSSPSNGGMHNLEGVGKQMEVDTSRNSWQGARLLSRQSIQWPCAKWQSLHLPWLYNSVRWITLFNYRLSPTKYSRVCACMSYFCAW